MHYYKESHPPQRDCTRTKDPATHAQPHQASYCKELADGTCICYKFLKIHGRRRKKDNIEYLPVVKKPTFENLQIDSIFPKLKIEAQTEPYNTKQFNKLTNFISH